MMGNARMPGNRLGRNENLRKKLQKIDVMYQHESAEISREPTSDLLARAIERHAHTAGDIASEWASSADQFVL